MAAPSGNKVVPDSAGGAGANGGGDAAGSKLALPGAPKAGGRGRRVGERSSRSTCAIVETSPADRARRGVARLAADGQLARWKEAAPSIFAFFVLGGLMSFGMDKAKTDFGLPLLATSASSLFACVLFTSLLMLVQAKELQRSAFHSGALATVFNCGAFVGFAKLAGASAADGVFEVRGAGDLVWMYAAGVLCFWWTFLGTQTAINYTIGIPVEAAKVFKLMPIMIFVDIFLVVGAALPVAFTYFTLSLARQHIFAKHFFQIERIACLLARMLIAAESSAFFFFFFTGRPFLRGHRDGAGVSALQRSEQGSHVHGDDQGHRNARWRRGG